MDLSETQLKREAVRRILMVRTSLLYRYGFYGLLLMHMEFSLDRQIETGATDGKRIYLNPNFMWELSDSELMFVLMHETLHAALRHCDRCQDRSNELFNTACDIVVNSNILMSSGGNPSSIRLRKYGISMHLTPDGKEGALFTAEEVYEMLKKEESRRKNAASQRVGDRITEPQERQAAGTSFQDDHSRWKMDPSEEAAWMQRVRDAAESVRLRQKNAGIGDLPLSITRMLKSLTTVRTDWRNLLSEFIQENRKDFSFLPPDRRYQGDLFLPDFHDTEGGIQDILFMADTSGSISEDMLTRIISEIQGAILQFDGGLQGYFGTFDTEVHQMIPLEEVTDFQKIHLTGGGGTSYRCIFQYLFSHPELNPSCLVVLTDGKGKYPREEETGGIPVLWLISKGGPEAPFGKSVEFER